MTTEKRQHSRLPASGVAIRVRFTTADEVEQYWLRDISRGGIFLRAKNLRPLQSQLVIVLAMPDGAEVRLRGEVVHVVTPAEALPNRPSGMGIQFVDLTPEMRQHIESYVGRLKQRSGQAATAAQPAVPAPGPGAVPASTTRAPQPGSFELEAEQDLLRRLCWILAEGGILGRPLEELFGVAPGSAAVLRREVYERMRRALAPDRRPAYLGEEEARAVVRMLMMLESLTEQD